MFKRNCDTEFVLQVEPGEEKLLRVSSVCPGLCLPAVRIPGTEAVWRSGQAKLSGGSFYAQWKVAFLIYQSQVSGEQLLALYFQCCFSSVRELYLAFI